MAGEKASLRGSYKTYMCGPAAKKVALTCQNSHKMTVAYEAKPHSRTKLKRLSQQPSLS